MPDGSSLRSLRMSRAKARPRSSADLLIELATRGQITDLLSEQGVELSRLQADRDNPVIGGREPVDWQHRLLRRGGAESDLEQFLAIVRTADCDAYRLLEHCGASCAALRKSVLQRMRDATAAKLQGSSTRVHRPAPTRPSTPVRRSAAPPGVGGTALAPATRRMPAEAPQPRAQRAAETELEDATQTETRPAPQRVDPGTLGPLQGRQTELSQLADALLRTHPRPPLIVGDHGSGRTLLALHLVHALEKPVFRLVANDYEDDDELRQDLEFVAAQGGIAILDDLDRLIAETPPAFLNALATAWSAGAPGLVTIVSHETRSRLAAWMPSLAQALDTIALCPLPSTDAHAAVKLGADRVLSRHGMHLAAGTHIGELSRLADRFLAGLAMPGRALDLLDLSCARTSREGKVEVDAQTWVTLVCERTGLPRERVAGSTSQDLLDLDQQLARRIVGHEHVVSTLCQLIRRNRAGFASDRPVATTLLLGPSGVGKTEIAKAVAQSLFESGPEAMLRLDMSEYAEAHAVARVVGAPPGYVGHEQGGALTDPMLAQPHRVVLLDEIEKAHRDVHQLLLQVFDEGRLTDGRGRTVDFRHAVIIMTSNLGSNLAEEGESDDEDILAAARAAFPVELWNRIEAPLVLHPLTRENMKKICVRLAAQSSERLLKERGIQYELEEAVCDYLVDLAGDDPSLGARPLRHLLAREIESLVADAILRGQFRAGQRVRVFLDGEYLSLGI